VSGEEQTVEEIGDRRVE